MSEGVIGWAYITTHRDAIRHCAALWGGVVAGAKAFDNALSHRNAPEMRRILNEVWFKAPDDQEVYAVPGFRQICNLLDETVWPPWRDDASIADS